MGLFGKIKNTYNSIVNNSFSGGSSGIANQFLKYGNQQPLIQNWSQVLLSDTEFYKGYPYAAINLRANRIVSISKESIITTANQKTLDLYKKNNDIIVHPYLKVIDESPTFSNNKFWYDISTYLDLEGVYYLMAIRTVGKNRIGNVQEFKLLNPYNIKRVKNEKTDEVGGYIEMKNGLFREIDKSMIIEIRKLNPFSEDDTFAMTDAASEAQFTINQSSNYTRHALKNNISAPGIISTDIILEDEMFANFVNRVKSQEQGTPLFGNGAGSIKWESMQIDLSRSANRDIVEMNRQELFAVSGAGKTMLAIEESGTTRDTSRVQTELFTEYHALPQIDLILDALNQDYKNHYPKEYEENGFIIKAINPMAVDKEADLLQVQLSMNSLELYNRLIELGYDSTTAANYAMDKIELSELGVPKNKPTPEITEDAPIEKKKEGLLQSDDANISQLGAPKDNIGSDKDFDIDAKFTSIKPLTDGSLSLIFKTKPVTQGEANEILYHYRSDGKISYKSLKESIKSVDDKEVEDIEEADIDDEKLNFLELRKNYNPNRDPSTGRFDFGKGSSNTGGSEYYKATTIETLDKDTMNAKLDKALKENDIKLKKDQKLSDYKSAVYSKVAKELPESGLSIKYDSNNPDKFLESEEYRELLQKRQERYNELIQKIGNSMGIKSNIGDVYMTEKDYKSLINDDEEFSKFAYDFYESKGFSYDDRSVKLEIIGNLAGQKPKYWYDSKEEKSYYDDIRENNKLVKVDDKIKSIIEKRAKNSKVYDLQYPQITRSEERALKEYNLVSAVNQSLRKGETTNAADYIQSAIDKTYTGEQTLYRGIRGDFANKVANLKPGDTITDKGFMSTSDIIGKNTNEGAMKFGKGGIIMEIKSNSGFGNKIDMLPYVGNLSFMSESEILLNRNTTLEFVGYGETIKLEDGTTAKVMKFEAL